MAELRYFRLEPRALSYGECWRIANDLGAFALLMLSKWRLKRFTFPLTLTASSEFLEIDPADFDPNAAARLDEPVSTLESLGFLATNHGSIPQVGKNRSHHGVLLLSADRTIGAAATDFVNGFEVSTITSLTTRFRGGSFGITINERRMLDQPPNFLWKCCPGCPVDRLYEIHRENLIAWQRDGFIIEPYGLHEPAEVTAELGRMQTEHFASRGVFVELTADELEERLARAEVD